MKLPPDAIERLLEPWPVARLPTPGKDGSSHQAPVVFVDRGNGLWSPIDGKPKALGLLARTRNVRRDPRVSLLLDHSEQDGTRLWWLRVDGAADLHQTADPETHPRVASVPVASRKKCPQYREIPALVGRPMLMRVRVPVVHGGCAAPQAFSAA